MKVQKDSEWAMLLKKQESVQRAAANFHSRWTWQHLERIDAELAGRVRRRQKAWINAKDAVELDDLGNELVREWQKAIARMEVEDLSEPCLCGVAPDGTRIVIAESGTAIPAGSVWFSPDEVAKIVSGTDLGRTMLQVKKVVAKAEIMKVTQK